MNSKLKQIFSFRTLLILGIACCFICIIPFTKDLIVKLMETFVLHRELRDFSKWNDILVHSMTYFALIGIFWFFFWYTSKGKKIGGEIYETAVRTFSGKKTLFYLGAIFVIYFIAYSALIRANYEYADDIRRCYAGHKAWVGWSRYVSEILAVFIHTNFFINDITPITQLWTLIVLTVTSYLLCYIVTEGEMGKCAAAMSVVCGLTIYYLANFSYKYDCPYMALSMLFGLLPFLFISNYVNFAVMSFISLILVCSSYQASNGIYIIFAMFTAFRMWLQKKPMKSVGIYTGISIAVYVAALFFFRIFLMNQFDSSMDSRGTGIATGMNIFSKMAANFKAYNYCILPLSGNHWVKFFIGLTAVLFPVSAVRLRNGRNVFATIGLSLVILVAMYCLTLGAYLVLEEALVTNRTFLGFDMLCGIIAVYSVYALTKENSIKIRRFAGAMTALYVYGLIVQAVVYGNFVQKQKEYENFRFSILAQDLSKIVDFTKTNSIYIGGITGMPGKSRMERKNYPIAAGSVSPVLTKYIIKGYNMDFEFLSEYTLPELDLLPEFKKQLTDLPMIQDTFYHTIYGRDTQYFVYLKWPMIKE